MADAGVAKNIVEPQSIEGEGDTGDPSELSAEERRFVAELEFVLCLANPLYLAHLVSNT